jgi:vancomycin permeability regulator SanA
VRRLTRGDIVGPVKVKILARRLLTGGALALALAVLAMAGGSLWVRGVAAGHVYDESTVPAAPVALVLGAQVYPDGAPSAYLAARLDLARRLLAAGKVRAILLSGDNGRWEYNEPGAMAVYLIARGVPAQQIVLDYAGFDTYDSCARARRIFGVRQAILVTQTFHIDRAVALCRSLGVAATGVGDDSVRVMTDIWRRNQVRERLAAVKAVADVVSGRDPVLLGRHETSVEEALRAG